MSTEYSTTEQLRQLISEINEIKQDIREINYQIDRFRSGIEEINNKIAVIENTLQTISKSVEKMEDRLSGIEDELKEVGERVDDIENELQETKKELFNRINAVRDKVMEVEKRVEKAEIRLDEHLFEQDVVLQKNSEALLNNLAMQFVLNVVSKSTSVAHIELSHLNKKPFIVIESNENIRLILISSEISREDVEVLENLGNALREYTDKEVKYNILTTEVTKSETPAWLYSLQ
jgi:chromosome segregation ATPase